MHISLLGYALLSLLARMPLSGYDIAKEMQRPHAFFFGQAQYGQIYPELARLEQLRLVVSQRRERPGKPMRKEYTVTAEGMHQLHTWVVAPTAQGEMRSEVLLKAHSLWLADPRAAVVQFRAQIPAHERALANYEADLAQIAATEGEQIRVATTPRFGDYVTLHRGVGAEREYLAWLQWVVALLEQRIAATDEPTSQ